VRLALVGAGTAILAATRGTASMVEYDGGAWRSSKRAAGA